MKRIISILLALLTLLTVLPLSVTAENSITDGALTWTYYESTKTLTVSGEGEMPDYEWISAEDHRNGVTRLSEEWTEAKHVVIEEGVTSIGDWAFIWFEEMEDISLPETLTRIGKGAFENTYLYSIEFPASLETLEGCFCTTEPPKYIIFKGDAPNLDEWTNFNMTVTLNRGNLTTVCYPEENTTWTEEVKSAFGPRIVWNGEITQRPMAAEAFDDVDESYWYCDSVQFVYERELMIGTAPATFDPNAELTRAQAMQMLFNMSGEYAIDYSGETPFEDVSAKAWCASAVNWAYVHGITKGVSETKFAPNRLITRQELAKMLKSFADYMECAFIESADISEYEDADKVANWAYNPVRWCVGAGIISGMSETTLAPTAKTTRAQTARMLSRFYTFVLDNMPATVSAHKILVNYIRENGTRYSNVQPEYIGVYYYIIEDGDRQFEVEYIEKHGETKSFIIKYYPAVSENYGDYRNHVRITKILELEPSYHCSYVCDQPSYQLISTGELTHKGYDASNGRFSYGEWNGTKYVYDDDKDYIGMEKRDSAVAEMLEYLNQFLSECGLEYKDLFIYG